jgi:SH3 domain protein
MNRLAVVVFLILGICLGSEFCNAEKAYVVNPSKITLREGPNVKEKIVTMLSQDEPVEVLASQEGWSHVRLLTPNREKTEGWVVSGFLANRVPWKAQAASLKEENTLLKEKLDKIESQWGVLSGEREEMRGKLEKNAKVLDEIQNSYQTLKKEAKGFLKLKQAYETAKAKMEAAQASAEKLAKENSALESSQRNKWFLTGAAVLLVGLILGLVIGRKEKKLKSSYY